MTSSFSAQYVLPYDTCCSPSTSLVWGGLCDKMESTALADI